MTSLGGGLFGVELGWNSGFLTFRFGNFYFGKRWFWSVVKIKRF